MAESKSIRQLEERMAAHDPGSLRHEVLHCAKNFKSSWIDLGRALWTVWKDKKFREWEYISFEAYCTKEIGIRSETAKKLLYSYSFLEREEPVVLKKIQETGPSAVPHYEAVNALRLLNQKQDTVPQEEYQSLREQVLEKGREGSDVRRSVRLMKQRMTPDTDEVRQARRSAMLRRMIGTLKSVKNELRSAHMAPNKLLDEIDSLAKRLEDILDS